MGNVGSKTRSLGQTLEETDLGSRGHIFGPIIMKLGQNFCLNEIWKIGKFVMSGQNQGH